MSDSTGEELLTPSPIWPQRDTHTHRLIQAALQAADPYTLIASHLRTEGAPQPTIVLAIGKAAGRMAQAAEDVLGPQIIGGLVITAAGHPTAHHLPTLFGGHPLPTSGSLHATRQLRALAAGPHPPNVRWLVLLSGGGSALLTLPLPGITLADIQTLTRALLACGAPIGEVNALRKHLSQVKGGRLAGWLYPAPVTLLVLSDVIGNRLDVIASGPLSPDRSSFGDCAAILSRYALWAHLPASITAAIRAGARGDLPETPKAGDRVFARVETRVVGDVGRAVAAAAGQAGQLGFRAEVVSTTLEGEARSIAGQLVATASEPGCYLWGGETTVTLDVPNPGQGGRNQELALAAALAMQGRARVHLFTLATDGRDGPTDAAGAVAEGETVARAARLGLDAADCLVRHDAYRFFERLGDLIYTGPTGTNVNDVVGMLVYP